jgi:hypothetical protein
MLASMQVICRQASVAMEDGRFTQLASTRRGVVLARAAPPQKLSTTAGRYPPEDEPYDLGAFLGELFEASPTTSLATGPSYRACCAYTSVCSGLVGSVGRPYCIIVRFGIFVPTCPKIACIVSKSTANPLPRRAALVVPFVRIRVDDGGCGAGRALSVSVIGGGMSVGCVGRTWLEITYILDCRARFGPSQFGSPKTEPRFRFVISAGARTEPSFSWVFRQPKIMVYGWDYLP